MKYYVPQKHFKILNNWKHLMHYTVEIVASTYGFSFDVVRYVIVHSERDLMCPLNTVCATDRTVLLAYTGMRVTTAGYIIQQDLFYSVGAGYTLILKCKGPRQEFVKVSLVYSYMV